MDNDFYRPQGTDSQSSDTNQATMGQEVNQEAAGGQNTESQAQPQDSTYHYGRNFNSETTYHTNAAYDGAYQDNSYTQQADEHAWQPGTGAAFAEENNTRGKKKKAKKVKQKKPVTTGKVYRTGVACVLVTVLINGAVLGAGYKYMKDHYVSSDDYKKSTSIASTKNSLNEISSGSSDVVTADKSSGTSTLSVSDVAKATLPSVVSITSTSIYKSSSNPFMYGGTYQVSGAGSGIIIGTNDTELLMVTNNHVVEGTTSLTVEFADGSSVDTAYVKGTNASNDIAVIAIKLSELSEETSQAISIATLGDSDELEVGDQVIAIGNALGYGQSVTVGYVSALNRDLTVENTTISAIQTDASINGGNSGGALINMKGEVIGINFAKQSSSSSSSSSIEGMGYAIPISQAKDIINELMNKEPKEKVDESEKGYIGITSAVSIDSSTKQMYNIPEGAYLKGIAEGSPADKAGVQIGDVVVAVDGEEVSSYDDLQEKMNYYAVGDTVKLTVMRANGNQYKEKEIEVTLCSYDDLNKLIGKSR